MHSLSEIVRRNNKENLKPTVVRVYVAEQGADNVLSLLTKTWKSFTYHSAYGVWKGKSEETLIFVLAGTHDKVWRTVHAIREEAGNDGEEAILVEFNGTYQILETL